MILTVGFVTGSTNGSVSNVTVARDTGERGLICGPKATRSTAKKSIVCGVKKASKSSIGEAVRR